MNALPPKPLSPALEETQRRLLPEPPTPLPNPSSQLWQRLDPLRRKELAQRLADLIRRSHSQLKP
jgi:hypothetical protein